MESAKECNNVQKCYNFAWLLYSADINTFTCLLQDKINVVDQYIVAGYDKCGRPIYCSRI